MKMLELWDSFNSNDELIEYFFYLYDRWQDEKEYVDSENYLNVLKRYIPEAVSISDDVFEVECLCSDGYLRLGVKVEGNRYVIRGEFYEV